MSRVVNGDLELSEAPEKADKKRLDHLMVEQHPEFNRSTLQSFIREGRVRVDGEVVKKPNAQISPDAEIVFDAPKQDKKLPKLPVIYEDENVLVVNKPAGLLSMAKGEYCAEPTLEDYRLLVHRLDRDTSGVVILAKNPETQKMLRKQFQDRKTHKTYYAVVEGHPKQPEALIDLPIIRNYKHPTTFMVDASGKPSQTYYKVIKQNDDFSMLELKPKTGRTHQLRVHLQYLGTPILGDKVYGKAPKELSTEGHKLGRAALSVPEVDNSLAPARLFLHAHQLEITIPKGDRRTFTAPLPEEFDHVF